LIKGEHIEAIVENLDFEFLYVPHVIPAANYPAGIYGAIALTNHRIIVLLFSYTKQNTQQIFRWLHILTLNSISERPLSIDKPNWPYQAIMMIPGGIGLVVQTRGPNVEHSEQLSSLLNEAIVRFGSRHEDTGSTAAAIGYEEEEEARKHRQQEDFPKKD